MAHILIASPNILFSDALSSFLSVYDESFQVTQTPDYNGMLNQIFLHAYDIILLDEDLDIPEAFSLHTLYAGLLYRLVDSQNRYEGSETFQQMEALSKNISCTAFAMDLQRILKGERALTTDVALTGWDQKMREKPYPALKQPLTKREKQVLSYVAKGASNKEIANALNLQVVTVKLHVRNICRKLSVSNRTQAALVAKENNWS